MKKLLLACTLIGIVSAANAQPPADHDDHPMGRHMMMRDHALDPAEHAAQLQKTLQLSDDQTAKVKKIFEDNAQQRKALDDKYKPQFEAFHADADKLRDQTHAQLNNVLTAKQKEAFEAQHKMHGGKMCPGDKDGDDHQHDSKMPMK